MTGCAFIENHAENWGGGVRNYDNANTTFVDCNFTNNSAYKGGGIYNQYSSLTLTSCNFTENLSHLHGGAISDYYRCDSVLTGCTFLRNSGTGIYTQRGSMMLTGCIIEGNWGDYGGGIAISESDANLSDCIFQGNVAEGHGGGINADNTLTQNSILALTRCYFNNNSAGSLGGALYNMRNVTSTLTWCRFNGNSAGHQGGGIRNEVKKGKTTLLNCILEGNRAGADGGGFSSYYCKGEIIMTNCLLSGNQAVSRGGAIHSNGSQISIDICTFSYNLASKAQGIGCFSATSGNSIVDVNNSILWDGEEEIYNGDESTISIRYSDVLGGWEGEGNIDEDPQFVDPGYWDANGTPEDANDDFWVAGDYHLKAGSPCIESGDNESVPPDTYDLDEDGDVNEPHPYDLSRRPRIAGTNVEIGAYEYIGPVCGDIDHPYPVMDFNKDCIVNFLDFAMFAEHWMVCTKPECD
jgi:predicted outer membrane repeat protein